MIRAYTFLSRFGNALRALRARQTDACRQLPDDLKC